MICLDEKNGQSRIERRRGELDQWTGWEAPRSKEMVLIVRPVKVVNLPLTSLFRLQKKNPKQNKQKQNKIKKKRKIINQWKTPPRKKPKVFYFPHISENGSNFVVK